MSRNLGASAVYRVMRHRRADLGGGSFEAFVRTHEPRLRQALVATYGPADGREAAVDALSWAWEHWEEVRVMRNPAGYLYRVGQSAVRRFAARPTTREVVSRSTEPPDPDPELAALLGTLSEQQRTVVVLVHAFGWRQSDVAEHLGISPSTTHAHLTRGVERLRRLFEGASDAR